MDTVDFIVARPDFFVFLVAILALIVGSFLNVLIYRFPQMMKNAWNQECREYLGLKVTPTDTDGISLWLPSSHCTQCRNRLKPWHNIPVLSYLWLRGRCAFCNARISARYPLVEIISCLTSLYVAIHFGPTWQTAYGLIFTWILIALLFIDLDHHLLPDGLTLLLLWIGLIASTFDVFAGTQDAIYGAAIGYLVFWSVQFGFHALTGKTGMGQGDFKLLAALGAFFGWQQLPILILLASVIGLIFGLVHIGIRHQFKSVPIPFGPWLAIAGWICLFWGNGILHVMTRFAL